MNRSPRQELQRAPGEAVRLRLEANAIEPLALTVAPSLAVRVRASCEGAATVHALVLRARMRVLAAGRAYSAEERARLAPLFGDASQWARTTRVPVAWAETSAVTGRFERATEVELVVPCSYDLSLATTKLFDALDGGALPISILFSGTLFCDDESGALRVQPVPSHEEARIDLPIAAWRTLMEAHHPEGVLLPLPRPLVDRVRRLAQPGEALSLERTIERLVEEAEQKRSAG